MDFKMSSIKKLHSTNYLQWSGEMEALLQLKKLLTVVKEGVDESAAPKLLAESKEKDADAKATILLMVEGSNQPLVRGAGSAKEAWDRLRQTFMGKAQTRLLQLKREIVKVEMQQEEGVSAYIGRGIALRDELLALGGEMEESELVSHLLQGLLEEFDGVTSSLRVNFESEDLELSKVMDVLVSHENLKKRRGTSALGVILSSSVRGGGSSGRCAHCGKPGHSPDKCFKKHPELQRCWNCQEMGHQTRQCLNDKKVSWGNSSICYGGGGSTGSTIIL